MKRNIPINVKSKERDLINTLNEHVNEYPCEGPTREEHVTAAVDTATGDSTTFKVTYSRDPKTGRFCSAVNELSAAIKEGEESGRSELTADEILRREKEYLNEARERRRLANLATQKELQRQARENAKKNVLEILNEETTLEDTCESRESVEDNVINKRVHNASKDFVKETLSPAMKKIKDAEANLSQIKKSALNEVQTNVYHENDNTYCKCNKSNYEFVNSPTHYNSSSVETIEKMRRIYGNLNTALWCEMTAFKYRDRIGSKPGEPVDREVSKIKWYEAKAKELYSL